MGYENKEYFKTEIMKPQNSDMISYDSDMIVIQY